jgi:hypothetical protein
MPTSNIGIIRREDAAAGRPVADGAFVAARKIVRRKLNPGAEKARSYVFME